ncbi:MAG: M48 family metallopeptidase [Isosphaeraceae bacterium]
MIVLREGGEAIARSLGGRPIDPGTAHPAERRLLNVVEEMALASGTPVPPVFVLDEEKCINAFAAGFTPGDAVIGVSQGCLDHLTRDELQGVIGHEFSHILNGDMRLNLRLIALIHGLLVVALLGQLIFRIMLEGGSRSSRSRSSDSKDSGGFFFAVLIAGGALWALGSIGVLLGRFIKCAISRQREYLADASSVQFTRNPDGLCGALKKIGGLTAGSRVKSPQAEEACHMFFGQGVASLSFLLATHPPLVDRIRALDPSFQGEFPHVRPGRTISPDGEDEGAVGVSSLSVPAHGSTAELIAIDPGKVVAAVGRPTAQHVDYASGLIQSLPTALAQATRQPFSARAVVYALLLDPDEAICRAQLAHLEANESPGTVVEVLRLRPSVVALGEEARIPLVDLAFPALRGLSPAQYQVFRANVDSLVKADRRVSLFEYALQHMLLRHLDRAFVRRAPHAMRFHSLDPVFDDANLLLSALARLGHKGGALGVAEVYRAGITRLQASQPGERAASLASATQCSLAAVDRALDRISQAAPGVKRRVLDACAASIACDGVVTLNEAELLRAIADSLDCPIPPFLSRKGPLVSPGSVEHVATPTPAVR